MKQHNIISKEKFIKLADKFENKEKLKNLIKNDSALGAEMFKEYFKIEERMDVEMSNLYKVYDNGVQAITNINMSIDSKEFVCLLGPSGCGKSTLLRMVAGLEPISAGLLSFNKKVVNSTIPSKRGLSMVFQNYALYPYMSVYKNIAFGLKIESRRNEQIRLLKKIIKEESNKNFWEIDKLKDEIRVLKKPLEYDIAVLKEKLSVSKFNTNKEEHLAMKARLKEMVEKQRVASKQNIDKINEFKTQVSILKKEGVISKGDKQTEVIRKLKKSISLLRILSKNTIDERVKEVCKTVGIENFLNRKPSELSGGQRQRVALARAISKNKKLFLFDEPLSNLDAKLRAGMRELIRKLHNNSGATSLYVTHDQIEAMTMADKVVIMKDGFIQQVDNPLNLYLNPANLFVAKFIGTPEINIIESTFDGNKLHIGKTTLEVSKGNIIGNVTNKLANNSYIGIRPQHIITDLSLIKFQKKNVLKGTISNIQLLGNEYLLTVLHGDLGKVDLIVSSYMEPKINDVIEFYINPNKLMIFDKDSEKNITTNMNDMTKDALDNWFAKEKDRHENQLLMKKQLSKTSLLSKIKKSFPKDKNNEQN